MGPRLGRRAAAQRITLLSVLFVAAVTLSCGHDRATPSGRPVAPTPAAVAIAPPADLAGAAPLPVGTGEVPIDDGTLGSRLVPQELPIPELAAGRTARFTFAGNRRGFFVRLPEGTRMKLLTPAYGHGRVFVGGGFGSSSLYGIDARTGRVDWAASAPDGGPTAAVVENDRVLFNTESCTLFVVDAATGRQRWARWLGDPLMSTPAVGGGRVFTGHISDGQTGFGGEPGGYRFSALDLDDGRPLWSRRIDTDVMNAPVLDGESVYFTTMGGVVYRLDQASGRVLWRKRMSASSPPWVNGGELHVAQRTTRQTEDGRKRAERTVVLGKESGDVVREHDPVDAAFVPARPDGRGVEAGWSFEGSRPTLDHGRLYQTIGNEVHARDAATGELLWRRRYTQQVRGRPATSPAVAGAQLVFGTADGVLYGLDIDTGLTTWAYDVGEPITAQPSVAHGWVYASTARGGLVGLEVADASLDGWHMWGGNAAHNGPVASSIPPATDDDERPGEGSLRLATAAERGELSGFPLTGTRVRAQVSGFVARVEVEQTFENPYARPVEAVYLFPLPDDAAVDAMELRTGSRVVQGQIRERGQARREYRRARDRGVLASLLEQERDNLFRQSIANVRPGDSVRVVLRYTQALPYEEGSYRFVFPMVAGPRYVPQAGEEEAATDGADVQEVVLADGERRDTVAVSIDADLGVPLRDVVSPTHEVAIARDGAGSARVDLVGVAPDRDLDVRFRVAGDAPSVGFLASPPRDGERGVFSLMVHPRLDVPDGDVAPRELVFVVDTSSSMLGKPMDLARTAMLRALGGLRPDDRFRIVRFSDATGELDREALPPTPENLQRARAFVRALDAHGTTEMVRGLRAALDPPADPARMRIVLLLTDGYIGNEAEVFREVDARLGLARVFAFGVGSAVNRFLLTRLAEVGRGDVQVVLPTESPDAAADAFHARIARPYLTDMAVDWGGLAVEDAYPRRLPDLFADRPLVVHARYARAGHGNVTVRGRIAGQPFEQVVPVTLPASGEQVTELESIWARTRIRDLMTAMSLRPSDALREEVTALGLRHGLLTQWTAFVAIDEGYRVDAPASERVDQPATLPNGVDYASSVTLRGGGYGLGSIGAVGYGSGGGGYASGNGVGYGSSESYPMMLQGRTVAAPQVRAAEAQVIGSLSSEVIRRVIHAHLSEIRTAYERALASNPSLTGRVTVRFVVGPTGSVIAAQIASSDLNDEATEQAILAAVRRWTFPAVEGGGNVTVNYPFVFRPSEE